MNVFTNECCRPEKSSLALDANNNGRLKAEKYSLRPRSLRPTTEKGLELKRDALNEMKRKNSAGGKPKQKPPPLSKYRRKTANARERNRMREINVAFETLRRAVPQISGSLNSSNEKLTKITTLRLAMKYIQGLRQILDGTTGRKNGDDSTDFDVFLSDGESLSLSETLPSPDHPFASSFYSEISSPYCPDFHCDDALFGIHDSLITSNFDLDDDITNSRFCEDFFSSKHNGGLS